jgi:threonine dehydrogenase-like Zn-dependent dehydrogenase
MRATVFIDKGDVRVQDVPDPSIERPTDAIVRVTHACICGSDLWFYRGVSKWEPGWRTGHEFMGVVEDVGSAVRTLKKGDRVIAPFAFSDGDCEFCHKGLYTSCNNGGFWGTTSDGGQGEAVRAPFADGTLVKLPDAVDGDEKLLKAMLPLTDVMGTGHHAALTAGVGTGKVAVVVGDGAVGLCGVLAAKRLGAARIILMSRNESRIAVGQKFGATDIVRERGETGIQAVIEMTRGGSDCVLECVGDMTAMNTSIGVARPGGTVGFVGVPHHTEAINMQRMFRHNISLRGGVAPVRAYIPEMIPDVISGKLDPSAVLDKEVALDGVPEGYAAMDRREAIKVMMRV